MTYSQAPCCIKLNNKYPHLIFSLPKALNVIGFQIYKQHSQLLNVNRENASTLIREWTVPSCWSKFSVIFIKWLGYLLEFALSSIIKIMWLIAIDHYLFLTLYLSFKRKQLMMHMIRRNVLNNNSGSRPPKIWNLVNPKGTMTTNEHIFNFLSNIVFGRNW